MRCDAKTIQTGISVLWSETNVFGENLVRLEEFGESTMPETRRPGGQDIKYLVGAQ